jgi:hypothetical protein
MDQIDDQNHSRLKSLLDTRAKAKLYQIALQREEQLVNNTPDVSLEENSIADLVLNVFEKINMSDNMAEKLSNLLSSNDPHEVAAAVKFLEDLESQ